MSEIKEITKEITKFRDERNWKQFHNAKDLALALSIEASELNELYLWKDQSETAKVNKDEVADELADVLTFALLLAEKYNFNIIEIIQNKMRKNALKYPVEKSKDRSDKYTDL